MANAIRVGYKIESDSRNVVLGRAEVYAIEILLRHREKVPAIKFYRMINNIGLAEAKNNVEFIEANLTKIYDEFNKFEGQQTADVEIPYMKYVEYFFEDYDCYAIQYVTSITLAIGYIQKRFNIKNYKEAEKLYEEAVKMGVLRANV